jgi:hypothetical protein
MSDWLQVARAQQETSVIAALLQTQATSRMLEQPPKLALLKQFCCISVSQCLFHAVALYIQHK